MVLAFRDWVTWQAFFNSDSRKSSSARAQGGQGERRVVSQPTQSDPGLLASPTSLNPTSPQQDTDDDRHSRRHLPNLFIRLHDLLDPRLGRG